MADNTQVHIAIIGDIVKSREIENRAEAQRQLERTLISINDKFYSEIISKFIVTLGDEFQGLVKRSFPIRNFLQALNDEFGCTYRTSLGIGLGTLSTPVRPEAVGMDGACFHQARNALETARKEKKNWFSKDLKRIRHWKL